MKIGDIIELKARTKHGKDRINQHGNLWKIVRLHGIRDFCGELKGNP